MSGERLTVFSGFPQSSALVCVFFTHCLRPMGTLKRQCLGNS